MRIQKIIYPLLIVSFLSASCNSASVNKDSNAPTPTISTPTNSQPSTLNSQLIDPISSPQTRVTKKPFGIYITNQNSPVTPEKFSGYHTGTDFEAFNSEQNTDVKIYAACDGKLLVKKSATGYGGVLVQACKIDGNDVTIIYGHLRLTSVAAKVGAELIAGQVIGVLGTGYTSETSDERKHLHFGIHKGTAVNILGYVQNESELSGWLNAMDYLK